MTSYRQEGRLYREYDDENREVLPEQECLRCGRTFYAPRGVEYCSQECEDRRLGRYR